MPSSKIATCLWFDTQALEAAEFYVSLFPNSEITSRLNQDDSDAALFVTFTLDGVPYEAINGGPHFKLSEAVSISVLTKDQAETDKLWTVLTADGGRENSCGWLVDRFGLSWQIVPEALMRYLMSDDPQIARRVKQAMMDMVKIDIAAIEKAALTKA